MGRGRGGAGGFGTRSGPSGRRTGTYAFVHGAALLAAASLTARLLGGLARIPLTRLLGGEGMGLFQMAYVIYTTAVTFAVAGVTVATSRIVAEWVARGLPREAPRVLAAALLVALASGALIWLGLDRGALWLAESFLGDPRAASIIRVIAPAVVVVSLITAFRGYFQGFQMMGPPAAAHVLEQVVRVGTMIWLVVALSPEGLERAVGGATSANTIGALAGLALLVVLFVRGRREREGPGGRRGLYLPPTFPETLGRLLATAVPVTLGAAVLPLMDAVQTFIVPGRLLEAGFDPGEATDLYGRLHGMAYPLAGLPAIVASAIATALVPAITEALTRGEREEVDSRTWAALRLTVMFSLPAAVGLFILARPINEMLFDIPEAGIPLMYVSGSCLLIALQQTTSGVLQGLGLVNVPFWGLLAGLAANTVTTYYLTGLPGLAINGAALGIVTGFLVAAGVNLAVVLRQTRAGRDLAGLVLRPVAATAAMALATLAVYGWGLAALGGNTGATLLAVTAGVLVYGVALLAVNGVTEREVEYIPVIGPRLSAFLRRR